MARQFGSKDVLDMVFYTVGTDIPEIAFDTLKMSGLNITNEKVHARGGRGNPKLITWELSKDGTVTIEDALLSKRVLELVSGLKSVEGVCDLRARDVLNVDSDGSVTLKHTPSEGVTKLHVYFEDEDCEDEFDVSTATLADKKLTLTPEHAGKAICVYYKYKSSAKARTYTIDAKHYAGTYTAEGTTVMRNRDGIDEAFHMIIPRLKFSSNLTLDFTAEGEPSTFSFECDILEDPATKQMVQFVSDEDEEV